jgi:hypothetical protein
MSDYSDNYAENSSGVGSDGESDLRGEYPLEVDDCWSGGDKQSDCEMISSSDSDSGGKTIITKNTVRKGV